MIQPLNIGNRLTRAAGSYVAQHDFGSEDGSGALIGGHKHAGAGALIGAGVGAVAGGLTGKAIDNAEAKAAAARRPPLGLTDVVTMAQNHVSDSVIINEIRTTGSVFTMSSNDVIYLKQQGVSDVVVQEMQATSGRPRRVYAAEPVYARQVYVVEQPPPPPPVVGVGVGFNVR